MGVGASPGLVAGGPSPGLHALAVARAVLNGGGGNGPVRHYVNIYVSIYMPHYLSMPHYVTMSPPQYICLNIYASIYMPQYICLNC